MRLRWPVRVAVLPQSDAPSPALAEAAGAFTTMSAWFKSWIWPPIDAGDERIDTKRITRRLENYLKPDAQQLHVGDGLQRG